MRQSSGSNIIGSSILTASIYEDNIKDWTKESMKTTTRKTENKLGWREAVLKWVHQWPTRLSL